MAVDKLFLNHITVQFWKELFQTALFFKVQQIAINSSESGKTGTGSIFIDDFEHLSDTLLILDCAESAESLFVTGVQKLFKEFTTPGNAVAFSFDLEINLGEKEKDKHVDFLVSRGFSLFTTEKNNFFGKQFKHQFGAEHAENGFNLDLAIFLRPSLYLSDDFKNTFIQHSTESLINLIFCDTIYGAFGEEFKKKMLPPVENWPLVILQPLSSEEFTDALLKQTILNAIYVWMKGDLFIIDDISCSGNSKETINILYLKTGSKENSPQNIDPHLRYTATFDVANKTFVLQQRVRFIEKHVDHYFMDNIDDYEWSGNQYYIKSEKTMDAFSLLRSIFP